MSRVKEGFQRAFGRIKSADKMKKRVMLVCGVMALACVCCAMLIIVRRKQSDTGVWKEAVAQIGTLNDGVTETGSVDVGTKTQSFELDLSEFTGESSLNFGSGMGGQMGGGMELLMGGTGMGGNGQSSQSTSARTLEVEEVYVEAGEEIAEGSPLVKLTQDSVESIRSGLVEDVTSAQIVYEEALTAQKQTYVSAEADYKTNTLYGSYMQAEYDAAVKTKQDELDQKQEAVEASEEALAKAKEELALKQELLTENKQVLSNAEYMTENTDERENLYWWLVAWQTKEDAAALVETLTEEIEELEESIVKYEEEAEKAGTALLLAQKELESEQVSAGIQMELRAFYAQNAQEIFDVAIGQSDFDTEQAKTDYEEAQAKLQEFDEKIVEQVIYADDGGLVTDVLVTAGDTLSQNTEMIYMNDYDEVTITLSVEEEDMAAAAVGSAVNVTVAAFPDEVFSGEVTEIGDAEIDSNTNKTWYSVTVTVKNTGDILYQDMTAEVTFLTEFSDNVLYIPVRAVVQDGEHSYVTVKHEDGTQEKREVTVGISDGINTEIKEGLSEGEVVLYESRVRQS